MDAGSYSKEIIDTVSSHSKLFYIRANKCSSVTERIRGIKEWKTAEINIYSNSACIYLFKSCVPVYGIPRSCAIFVLNATTFYSG
jgi:hypothetical protein